MDPNILVRITEIWVDHGMDELDIFSNTLSREFSYDVDRIKILIGVFHGIEISREVNIFEGKSEIYDLVGLKIYFCLHRVRKEIGRLVAVIKG